MRCVFFFVFIVLFTSCSFVKNTNATTTALQDSTIHLKFTFENSNEKYEMDSMLNALVLNLNNRYNKKIFVIDSNNFNYNNTLEIHFLNAYYASNAKRNFGYALNAIGLIVVPIGTAYATNFNWFLFDYIWCDDEVEMRLKSKNWKFQYLMKDATFEIAISAYFVRSKKRKPRLQKAVYNKLYRLLNKVVKNTYFKK